MTYSYDMTLTLLGQEQGAWVLFNREDPIEATDISTYNKVLETMDREKAELLASCTGRAPPEEEDDDAEAAADVDEDMLNALEEELEKPAPKPIANAAEAEAPRPSLRQTNIEAALTKAPRPLAQPARPAQEDAEAVEAQKCQQPALDSDVSQPPTDSAPADAQAQVQATEATPAPAATSISGGPQTPEVGTGGVGANSVPAAPTVVDSPLQTSWTA